MARLSFGAIRDKAAIAPYGLSGIQLSATYHPFLSDRDRYDYGPEWNLLAERSFGNHFLAGLKRADYDADHNAMNLARNSATGQAFDLTHFWVAFSFPIKDFFQK